MQTGLRASLCVEKCWDRWLKPDLLRLPTVCNHNDVSYSTDTRVSIWSLQPHSICWGILVRVSLCVCLYEVCRRSQFVLLACEIVEYNMWSMPVFMHTRAYVPSPCLITYSKLYHSGIRITVITHRTQWNDYTVKQQAIKPNTAPHSPCTRICTPLAVHQPPVWKRPSLPLMTLGPASHYSCSSMWQARSTLRLSRQSSLC